MNPEFHTADEGDTRTMVGTNRGLGFEPGAQASYHEQGDAAQLLHP